MDLLHYWDDDQELDEPTWKVVLLMIWVALALLGTLISEPFVRAWKKLHDRSTPFGAYLCETGILIILFAILLLSCGLYQFMVARILCLILALIGLFCMIMDHRIPQRRASWLVVIGGITSIANTMMHEMVWPYPTQSYYTIQVFLFIFLVYAPWAYLFFACPPAARPRHTEHPH